MRALRGAGRRARSRRWSRSLASRRVGAGGRARAGARTAGRGGRGRIGAGSRARRPPVPLPVPLPVRLAARRAWAVAAAATRAAGALRAAALALSAVAGRAVCPAAAAVGLSAASLRERRVDARQRNGVELRCREGDESGGRSDRDQHGAHERIRPIGSALFESRAPIGDRARALRGPNGLRKLVFPRGQLSPPTISRSLNTSGRTAGRPVLRRVRKRGRRPESRPWRRRWRVSPSASGPICG